ncbi:hypothetical protein [Pseudochryseolinea flava]|uniref:hypothetical protein n=1 Tax=Pseudochryseolinea flava TaxID=2059302 RepID=UPI001403BB50|nr:hypothetical protein [Pseudochryseolinea flava]
MEKEFNHQEKNGRGAKDEQTPLAEGKRDTNNTTAPDSGALRPRRRIRAYQRIDYWQ